MEVRPWEKALPIAHYALRIDWQRKRSGGRPPCALRVPRRGSSGICAALCRNARRAKVSDQRGGGYGAERAADGMGQLGGGIEAVKMYNDITATRRNYGLS